MGDVKAAQGQNILVLRPLAADQLDVQAFFFEVAILHGGEDGSFARQADVADADFRQAGFGIGSQSEGFAAVATEKKDNATAETQRRREEK